MKIYIPSYGRPTTICTPYILTDNWSDSSIEWKVVLHNEEQKEIYLKAKKIREQDIIVSNVPLEKGLGAQRAWIEENLVELDEWYIQMDDNIQYFTKLPEPYYSQDFCQFEQRFIQDELFGRKITIFEFMEVAQQMIDMMEKEHCFLGGFANTENSYFRGSHWNRRHFIVGKCLLLKKNEWSKFSGELATNDDYEISVSNLLHHGKVLRNDFVYPKFTRYAPGGLGSLENRYEKYAIAIKQLMAMYPGAFGYNKARKDRPVEASVKMRTWSDRTFKEWRKQLGGI